VFRILLLLSLCSASAFAHPAPTRSEVAKGVYLFRTEPYGDVGLDGNSVAIVGDDGVLVFDANGTPDAARAVLKQIREVTDQPVRYLVYSHWHWDHWYGGEVYKEAFPNLVIVSHEATRRLMDGPAIAFNQPGLEQGLPAHIADVDSSFRRTGDAGLRAHLEADRAFLAAKTNFRPTLANLTYRDSLTIHLGKRTVRVLHHDRAITPGDTYLWLPDDGVVVTGDLLINPVTFALFCYPAGWISSLKAIDALDARVIVPGHGAALQDETLLHATIALLEREKELALAAKKSGKDAGAAKAAVLADPRIIELRTRITGGDASRNDAFALYLVEWFVKRVYQEAEKPLDDSIPNTF
jgi:glyoxylase-like metal-dependent hydrolase (beta-lactamase superfamily II)